MAPGQRNPRILTDASPTADHLAGDFGRQYIDRPSQDGNRQQGRTAHRVDIADGIGSCNAPEVIRVIHDGHEEIGGGNDTPGLINSINGRIITGAVAHPELRVKMLGAAPRNDDIEDFRRDLAATTGTVAVLG